MNYLKIEGIQNNSLFIIINDKARYNHATVLLTKSCKYCWCRLLTKHDRVSIISGVQKYNY